MEIDQDSERFAQSERVARKKKELQILIAKMTGPIILAFDTIGHPSMKNRARRNQQNDLTIDDREWQNQGYKEFFPLLLEMIDAYALQTRRNQTPHVVMAGDFRDSRFNQPNLSDPGLHMGPGEAKSTKDHLLSLITNPESEEYLVEAIQNTTLLTGRNEDAKINSVLNHFYDESNESSSLILLCSEEFKTAAQLRIHLYQLRHPHLRFSNKEVKVLGLPRRIHSESFSVWLKNQPVTKIMRYLKLHGREHLEAIIDRHSTRLG